MKTFSLVITLTLLLAIAVDGPGFVGSLDAGDPGPICPDQPSGGLLGNSDTVCDPPGGDSPACRT